jgi:hypothetical protein
MSNLIIGKSSTWKGNGTKRKGGEDESMVKYAKKVSTM